MSKLVENVIVELESILRRNYPNGTIDKMISNCLEQKLQGIMEYVSPKLIEDIKSHEKFNNLHIELMKKKEKIEGIKGAIIGKNFLELIGNFDSFYKAFPYQKEAKSIYKKVTKKSFIIEDVTLSMNMEKIVVRHPNIIDYMFYFNKDTLKFENAYYTMF